MTTTFDRMINRTPFAKVLIDVSTASTLDEVLTQSGLDFEVSKVGIQSAPIITADGVTTLDFESDAGIVFDHHGKLRAGRAVGAGYEVVQNADAFGPLQYLKDEGFVTSYEQAGHLDGGGKCFVLAKLASESKLADPHQRMLLLTTSHDGTIAVTARGWQQRLSCANQIPSITRSGKGSFVRIPHSRYAAQAVARMREALLEALRVMDDFDIEYSKLCEQPAWDSLQQRFVTELFPLRPDVAEWDRNTAVFSRFDRGQRLAVNGVATKRKAVLALMSAETNSNIALSRAAMFNAAVEWSDYGTGSKNAAARILKGTDLKFKTRAFELASSL